MEKIIFEDLPSTNTPLNAENLNKIQDNVENEINSIKEKNIITLGLNTDINLTNNSWNDFYLDTVITQVGNKLINNNGQIRIGTGVSVIKVSLSVGIRRTISVANGIRIRKNTNPIAENFSSNSTNTDNQNTVSINPIALNVTEGDIIDIQTINSMTVKALRTFLTIEVIN